LAKDEGKRLVKKFYHLEEDEVPESEESGSEKEEIEESEESEEEVEYDPARGIGVASSSEDSDEEEEDLENEDETTAVIIEEDIPRGDATSRLAAVNLDWDNIHAVDILAVLQSFIPPTSTEVVRKVSIYPSNFGKERMQKEATEGPAIFEKERQKSSNITVETGEEGEIDATVLRKYQLERLRYYYAIIECSSVNIAQHLYKNVDGSEIGGTANIFDLRFVPNDTTFDEKPNEEATSVPDSHQPPDFVTEALQHSKPKLTWEGEDPERKRLIADAFKADTDSGAWEALIGSSDEEEEQHEDEMREKYRRLLLGGADEGAEEVSKDSGDGMVVTFPETAQDGEDEEKDSEEETTLEKYKRKERERKQRKQTEKQARREAAETDGKPDDLGFDDEFFERSVTSQKRKDKEAKKAAKKAAEAEFAQKAGELELIMHDEADQSANHFNLNHILKAQKKVKHKKKKRRDAEKELDLQEDFQMDVNDPRFADIYRGGEFAIDPNSAAFRKRAPGMEALIAENRRRKREAEGLPDDQTEKKKKKKKPV